MSVLTPKRVIQFVVASLLAVPLLANHPSPRLQTRMAFDEAGGNAVLFGGRGIEDPATGLTHATDETWIFVHDQWVQQFPDTRPAPRSVHAMVYDSKRARVLLFGGRLESNVLRGRFSLLNDTWAWQNGQWQQLDTATKPLARQYHALTYDRDRDRAVLFGGYQYGADGKTIEPLYDTWEFDGTNWSEAQASGSGPKVDKPQLAYDAARQETILVGIDTDFKTQMYRWKSASKTWEKVTADPLPTCVHDAALTYQAHTQTVLAMGGLCSGDTPLTDEVWEWNGTSWTKLDTTLVGFAISRVTGAAVTYDPGEQRILRYGGSSNFGSLNESGIYQLKNKLWRFMASPSRPAPRSLSAFRRDSARGVDWLFGGLTEFSYGTSISYEPDLWSYTGAKGWTRVESAAKPGSCVTPASTFDTDRNVLVLVCGGQDVFEWNGAEWKTFTPKPVPDFRRFAAIAYDQNIKKTVMFGGYDEVNYRDETWTWDGTTWTKLKPSKKPGHRAQMAMWYDTRAKKTIIYSGSGRPSIDDHVTRYSDMWSFDGTTWTEMTKTAAPGIRFGSQIAIDPRDGKVLLFGGLRATIDAKKNVTQSYINDTWLWDGASGTWTELHPSRMPAARQNGALEFDEASGRFILNGGFAGQIYLSDTWTFDGTNWTPVEDKIVDFRRRSSRP
ncbi:MAG TPA: kelch repeat-containing protein [Thermoanaerobaculia bacterium]|nr:kelch repeat-containing protein [Thermoanaerobaculia bacterium]